MEKAYFKYTGDDKKGKVIASPTADVLWSFCEQEPEFAQAVEQSGKSFNECIKEVARGIGQAASDLSVFTKAVQFYFEGATISYNMTINMSGSVEAAEKKPYKKPELRPAPPVSAPKPSASASKKLTLNIDDLLDF
jgi:hypothetical protein